ncbi:MAG: response regulator transcription factor [Bacteroidota bacterium]
MKNILIVEDDAEITKLLHLHFNTDLYNLISCDNGNEAMKKVEEKDFDLLILDIALPDISGMELCKNLRKNKITAPIMMLTARSEESDKVLALELGADDYVTKPFGILELMARVKALLRRGESNQQKENIEKEEIIARSLVINIKKRKVSIEGRRLDLTSKEFDLLLLLAGNPGKTFSRHELLEQVWGIDFSGYDHTITSHINRLRIKIEMDLQNPVYILTSWGIGYRFSE